VISLTENNNDKRKPLKSYQNSNKQNNSKDNKAYVEQPVPQPKDFEEIEY
jgi:hypothetical protein